MSARNLFSVLLCVSIVVVLSSYVLEAQITFDRTYGGDNLEIGYAGQQTTDGGYIFVGQSRSYGPGDSDVYLVKTDQYGDTLWTKVYGGDGDDIGYDVEQTPDGGYIVVGETSSNSVGYEDYYVLKTDANGNAEWDTTMGTWAGERFLAVTVTADGHFVATGTHESTRAYGLIKFDAHGNIVWETYNSYHGINETYDIEQTSDGGYILTGTWDSPWGTNKILLLKTNDEGGQEWMADASLGQGLGEAVKQTSDGGYIVCGSHGNYEARAVKTNAVGDTMWIFRYPSTGYNATFTDVVQTPDKGYVMICGGACLHALIKIDANGNLQWEQSYPPTNPAGIYSLTMTSDGGFFIVGSTAFHSGADIRVIKTDSESNITGVESVHQIPPRKFLLKQNYPNPFNPTTSIQYSILSDLNPPHVALKIYNILGQEVRTLIDEVQEPGMYSVVWDGRNGEGNEVPSGVYLYTLSVNSGQWSESRRMVLLR